jgi:hypothetical protein
VTRPKKAAAASAAAANPERGEHSLVLGARTYRLRPSHTALRAIEHETERSTLALVRLGNTGELTIEQLGIVGAELIRAGADPKDDLTRAVAAERIGELIVEQGLPGVTAALTLCLLDAATGGCTASGEAKAVPARARDDAGAA